MDVDKIFKYSVIAIRNAEEEETHEIVYEHRAVVKLHDRLSFRIGLSEVLFEVEAVTKVDHIDTPNDQFDYRLFAVAVK